MTAEQHFLFGLATLLTLMAPALTLPCIAAWLLMAWLGRAVDESNVSSASGLGCTWAMILFVGLGALAMVFVFGAALEGRI
jgi:uncharacterized membrane protein YhdT